MALGVFWPTVIRSLVCVMKMQRMSILTFGVEHSIRRQEKFTLHQRIIGNPFINQLTVNHFPPNKFGKKE
ncbi:MAG: hypothetical protein A4S16_00860 [Proteobacteria bacterium SG_bin6]|nr:MAG: hypothetical protein A4S16_00860 [Proteobacteria bacterium SG_bin6]